MKKTVTINNPLIEGIQHVGKSITICIYHDPGVHTFSNGDPGYPPTTDIDVVGHTLPDYVDIDKYLEGLEILPEWTDIDYPNDGYGDDLTSDNY